MKFRPEATIFPMMCEEELRSLAEDIDEHGQIEPVKVYKGDILDGRNRWQAITCFCKKVKKAKTETVNPKSPISYVLSENEKRRHMTTSQRHAAGAEALPYFEAEAKERRKRKPKSAPTEREEQNGREAAEDAAKAVGTSRTGVARAKRVKEQGSKKLFEAVKDGDISTDRAEKIVKKTSDKTKQNELLKATMESKNATRVKGLTGEVEWYTPKEYLDAAVKVMGSIDLDPASSDAAQKCVKAKKFYSMEKSGLEHPWWGNVFLNPPYKMPLIRDFVFRMVEMYEDKEIKQGILLTNNATDTEWFHKALCASTAVCFTRGRINFIQVRDGHAEKMANPTHGQSFFYFGNREKTFCKVFGEFGSLIRRYV